MSCLTSNTLLTIFLRMPKGTLSTPYWLLSQRGNQFWNLVSQDEKSPIPVLEFTVNLLRCWVLYEETNRTVSGTNSSWLSVFCIMTTWQCTAMFRLRYKFVGFVLHTWTDANQRLPYLLTLSFKLAPNSVLLSNGRETGCGNNKSLFPYSTS